MNGRINVLKSTAVFVLFMFVSTFVPVGTADAATYNETIYYDDEAVGRTALGDVATLQQGDVISTDLVKHGVKVSDPRGYANVDSVDISTVGDGAHGVYVRDGASADVKGGTRITTSGLSSHGVYLNSSDAKITDAAISTSGSYAAGVYAEYNSSVDITNTAMTGGGVFVAGSSSADITDTTITGGSVSVHNSTVDVKRATISAIINGFEVQNYSIANIYDTTISATGNGVFAVSSDVTVTNGSITTTGQYGYGVYATKSSSADVIDTTITTSGDSAYGVQAYNSSYVAVTGGTIATTGQYGNGVNADNYSSADITGGSIRTEGGYAYGVYANNYSSANVTDATITTSSNDAYGIYANNHSSANVIGTTITTSGNWGHGVAVLAGSSATVKSTDITTSNQIAHGIFVEGQSSADVAGATITTTGGEDVGVFVTISSSADITGTTITTTGDGGYGIHAALSSDVAVTGGGITTSGYGAYGVHAVYYSNAAVKSTDITTKGEYGNGLYANNHSSADITGGSIRTEKGFAKGVYTNDNSNAKVTSTDITTLSDSAYGVQAEASSDVTVTSGTIATTGQYGNGVYAYKNSSADITNTTITTTGKNAKGVYANDNSSADVTGATINTSGNDAYGISANNHSSANVIGTTISTSGNWGHGVAVLAGSSATVKSTDITTSNQTAHGIFVEGQSSADVAGATITTTGGGDTGVFVTISSSADITGTTITTTGDGGYGIHAALSSDVTVTGGSITTSGAYASALNTFGSSDITVDGTAMTVNGDASVFGLDYGTNSITVKNVAPVNSAGKLLESGGTNTFTAENSTLKGDTEHTTGTDSLSVNLINTNLTGGMNAVKQGGSINMDIDSTSTWNVTKDSAMHGRLNNAGTMDFGTNVSDGAKKVNVSDYNGAAGSKLFMKTDINTAADMDQILASNLARGTSDITIYNTANAGVERSAALLRGENGGGSSLTLTNWDEETGGVKYIHAGAWKYSLVKETDAATGAEEWFLKRGDKIPPKPDPDLGPTSTGRAIIAAAFLHDVWYTETNTWNSRMGIYRDNLWNGGLWFTGVRNREDFDHEHDNTVADRQDFTTGTIGFDKKYEMKDGNFWGGVMAGFGRTDNTLLGGIGDVDMDSYHMSLYGVYRSNSGFYVNGIVKYNDYRSELNILRPDNFSKYVLGFDQIHGEWSQDGLGISIQAGKRFDFKGDKGWYWEPQAQFSWNRVFASDYTTDSGIDVAIDDMDYIRLRGGVVLGRSWTLKNGTLLDLYADASIIHDFDADTNVTMSGGTYSSTLGGTWGIYGIGANWQFKPGQFFHARFQYSDGEPFTEPFAVYLGLSFEM